MSRLPLTLGVAAAVVVIDQIAKAMAVANLVAGVPIQLLGDWVRLVLVRNPGAAFSLGGNYTLVISLVAVGVTIAIGRTARTLTSNWWAVVLGGVLGGALGNLIDRLVRAPGPLRGHVVDFVALPNWPVFNVADMALVGSAFLAVILTVRGVDLRDAPDLVDHAEMEQPPAGPDPEGATRTDPGPSAVSSTDGPARAHVAAEAPPRPGLQGGAAHA